MGSGGVEKREKSLRIVFTYGGKQHKETLYLDGKPVPPSPPNVKYAARLQEEIQKKVRQGTFRFRDYFPDSPRAEAEEKAEQAEHAMLFDVMDRWLELLELKASTKGQYEKRINSFWKANLKNGPIKDVKYSDILEALKKGTWTSGKSRNNELSMIKQVFAFAKRDKLIDHNPCDDIDRVSYQRPEPDPFSLDETFIILDFLNRRESEQILNYEQLKFFSGLRTSEAVGLKWANIDFNRREMLIDASTVYDEEGDTKTSTTRIVKLNSIALEALERQKAHTFLAGGHVFHDPKTGEAWSYARITDVRVYWKNALKQTGIRYRKPYNSRHTYATVGLMASANPGFLAKQLGHSLEMFFNVYAKWINGKSDDIEMAKIEAQIQQIIPTLTLKTG